MYDSFWLGASLALMVRLSTFRLLRWPMTSGTSPPTQRPSPSCPNLSPADSSSRYSTWLAGSASRKPSNYNSPTSSINNSGKMIVTMICDNI